MARRRQHLVATGERKEGVSRGEGINLPGYQPLGNNACRVSGLPGSRPRC